MESVDHPQHYNQKEIKCSKCSNYVECIDIVRHKNFNIGNAIKYIWRCEDKGKKVEDLKKAIWYLQDEIDKEQNA